MFNLEFNPANRSIKLVFRPMTYEELAILIKKYPAYAAAFPTTSSKKKFVKFNPDGNRYQVWDKPVGFKADANEEERNETVVFENSETDGTGWSHTITVIETEIETKDGKKTVEKMKFNSATHLAGEHDPNEPHGNPRFALDAFIRPVAELVYDKDSAIVKSCKEITRTSKIYYHENGSIDYGTDTNAEKKPPMKVESSRAPTVYLGGRPYIWLNRKECESGKSKEMLVVCRDGYGIAPAFDLREKKEENTMDLFNAKELLIAYNVEGFQTITPEEEKYLLVGEYRKPKGSLSYARVETIGTVDKYTQATTERNR